MRLDVGYPRGRSGGDMIRFTKRDSLRTEWNLLGKVNLLFGKDIGMGVAYWLIGFDSDMIWFTKSDSLRGEWD